MAAETCWPALEQLLAGYRTPIMREIQSRERCTHHEAEDLTHDFIASCLRKDFLKNVDPAIGSFRVFVKVCITNFLTTKHSRKKILSSQSIEALTEAELQTCEVSNQSNNHFHSSLDVAWAHQVLSNALKRLPAKCSEHENQVLRVVKDRLIGTDCETAIIELAKQLNITSSATRSALYRVRQKLRNCIRDEIRQSVSSTKWWKVELESLISILAIHGEVR